MGNNYTKLVHIELNKVVENIIYLHSPYINSQLIQDYLKILKKRVLDKMDKIILYRYLREVHGDFDIDDLLILNKFQTFFVEKINLTFEIITFLSELKKILKKVKVINDEIKLNIGEVYYIYTEMTSNEKIIKMNDIQIYKNTFQSHKNKIISYCNTQIMEHTL